MRPMSGKVKRFIALVLVMMLVSVSAMAEMQAMVFSSKMSVYFAPSSASEKIGCLPKGTGITVEAVRGEWARVNYMGHVGFAKVEDMITLENVKASITTLTPILYITRDDLTPRMGTLDRHTTVYLRGIKGDKVLVSDKYMTILAYVPADCVK